MAQLEMRPVEINLFRANGAGDSRVVPAYGASIAVAFEGATVTAAATCYDHTDTDVSVAAPGRIKVGDTVQVGSTSAWYFAVDGISADGLTLTLGNGSGTNISLSPGDRLIVTSRVPAIYADANAQLSLGGNVVSVDVRGYARFYCPETRVDYLATGGGLPSPLAFQDVLAGWVEGGGGFVTAKDYPSLQEAIDACPSGGRVYAPAGTYVAPSGGFVLNKPLELFGDSISATVLTPYSGTSAGQPVIKIDSSGSTTALRQIYLHDFSLANPSLPTSRLAGSHGISCVTASGHQVTDIKLERVIASALGDDAIHIQGFDVGASAIVFLYVSVVQAIACQGSGFFVQNTTVAEFHNCYANANALFGAYCYSSQAAWYSCAFENNCLRTTSDYVIAGDASSFPYNADTGAQLRMRYSVPARVESCDFEQFGDTTAGQSRLAKKAIVFEASTGGLVSNSSFFNGGGATAVTGTGIHVTSDSNQGGWVTILTNNFINVETPVELQTGVRATTVMPQRISATLPGAPTMSGVLGLAVLARPFSEVPGAPIAEAAGQLIFDTTSGRLKCWDGSFWRTLSW